MISFIWLVKSQLVLLQSPFPKVPRFEKDKSARNVPAEFPVATPNVMAKANVLTGTRT